MTSQSTKELLKSLPVLKGKYKIIAAYYQITSAGENMVTDEMIQTSLLIEIIETCLTILTEEEKFVIESHLIKHLTWMQIELLFVKIWGPENMRSERTLKRMQQNALSKITKFINEYELENYIAKTKFKHNNYECK